MYPKVDFAQMPHTTAEFEEKTQPRYGSTDSQFDNILSLLGLASEDIDVLLNIADSYVEPEEMEFYHELRGTFVLGFCLALYALRDKNLNPLSLH